MKKAEPLSCSSLFCNLTNSGQIVVQYIRNLQKVFTCPPLEENLWRSSAIIQSILFTFNIHGTGFSGIVGTLHVYPPIILEQNFGIIKFLLKQLNFKT